LTLYFYSTLAIQDGDGNYCRLNDVATRRMAFAYVLVSSLCFRFVIDTHAQA